MRLGDTLRQMAEEDSRSGSSNRRQRWPKLHLKKRLIVSLIVAAFASFMVAGFIVLRTSQSSSVPVGILDKLDFAPLLPTQNTGLSIDNSTYKYNAEELGFSYVGMSKALGKLTFSEQATPQEFIDVPDVYSKLTDSMNRYSVFQNQMGTIYLTQPNDQPVGQTAVMNAVGVLIFVRSARNLSDGQWRQLFATLSVVQLPGPSSS